MIYLYLTIATIAAAVIDYIRIRQAPVTRANIDHRVSAAIGVALIIAAVLIGAPVTWRAVLYMVAGIAIRGLLYSPLLNVLRGLPIGYTSTTTTSKIDHLLTIGWQIAISVGVLGICIILNEVI